MTVLRPIAILALTLMTSAASAAGAVVVQQSTGAVVVRPDGAVQRLSRRSEVNAGDTLTTRADGSAFVTFPDGSSFWMHPNSRVKIESYQFIEAKPEADRAFIRLLKGGIRTQSGIVGKRGPDDYTIMTRAGAISPRGSAGETVDCTQGCRGFVADSRKMGKGVYHVAFDGSYIMRNGAGTLLVSAGEAGFARDHKTAPVLLSVDQHTFSLAHDARSTGSNHGAPRSRMRVQGRYETGFETSRFVPCGRSEEWWMRFPECQSAACGRIEKLLESCETPACEAYLDVTLDVSRVGYWGHYGRYEREARLIRLHRASLKPLGACR